MVRGAGARDLDRLGPSRALALVWWFLAELVDIGKTVDALQLPRFWTHSCPLSFEEGWWSESSNFSAEKGVKPCFASGIDREIVDKPF